MMGTNSGLKKPFREPHGNMMGTNSELGKPFGNLMGT
jgi:hypothetical protein